MKDTKDVLMFLLFQQMPSIKSQSSDTPLESEAPLSHNLEGQVTMLNALETKLKATRPWLSSTASTESGARVTGGIRSWLGYDLG